MDQILFGDFILATALGALIGIEREMPRTGTRAGGAHGFGGIRSYALIGLLGAIATWMDIISGGGHLWKFSGLAASAIIVSIAYGYSSFGKGMMGVTSEYAALLTYMVGVITMSGQRTAGVILAIVILIILSSKTYLAKWRSRLSRAELGDALKFAVIALVILPLLPDQKFSILELLNIVTQSNISVDDGVLTMRFFNPFSVWFFVVIMAGVEYVGYILSKTMGSNGGVVLSGAIGGLVSSTATTAAMTNKSVSHPENRNAYVAATLVASTIMCLRVILLSSFFNPKLLSTIAFPASAMLIGLGATTYYFYRRSRLEKSRVDQGGEPEYESPFRLMPAIKFAMIVVLVKFISGLGVIYKTDLAERVAQYMSPETVEKVFFYILGALSGLADVDAITYDMSTKSKDMLIPLTIAASTILIATMANNVVKASIAYRFGEKQFGRNVLFGFGLSITLGIAAIIIMNFVAPVGAFAV